MAKNWLPHRLLALSKLGYRVVYLIDKSGSIRLALAHITLERRKSTGIGRFLRLKKPSHV